MSNINLLPWREAAKEKAKKTFYLAIGSSALAAAGIVFMVNSYISHLNEIQNQRNDYLQREISIFDSQIGQINKIKTEKKLLTEKMTLINDLQRSRNTSVALMNKLPEVVSTGVYLKTMNYTGTSVATEGDAEAYSRIATTMRQIDATGWLDHININNITTNSSKTDDSANKAPENNLNLNKFSLEFNVMKERMEQ